MSSKTKSTFEFCDAYKLKSTIDRKAQRLQRKSIDWKMSRQEETNRRRNLHNISPLQELSDNSNLNDSYKGKTPVKIKRKG